MKFPLTKNLFTPATQNNDVKTHSDFEDSGLKDAYKLLLHFDLKSLFDNLKFATVLTTAVLTFEAVDAVEKIETAVGKEIEKAKNLCHEVRDEVVLATKQAYQAFNFWSKSKAAETGVALDPNQSDKSNATQPSDNETTIVASPSLR